jgi:hypothetical protein
MPDVGLIPSQNSQAHEDTDGRTGNEEMRGTRVQEQAGTGQDRPSEPGKVGIYGKQDHSYFLALPACWKCSKASVRLLC